MNNCLCTSCKDGWPRRECFFAGTCVGYYEEGFRISITALWLTQREILRVRSPTSSYPRIMTTIETNWDEVVTSGSQFWRWLSSPMQEPPSGHPCSRRCSQLWKPPLQECLRPALQKPGHRRKGGGGKARWAASRDILMEEL